MPRESNSWAYVRRQLSPFGVLVRVENSIAVGFPDVIYLLFGVCGLLEMKATAASLTLAQVLFAEGWLAAGGLCHTLLHADREWHLLDPAGTRRLFERQDPRPIVRAKDFPLKDMLRALAPPERRIT